MKILISGGHLTPALALIDYIQDKHPEHELVFVGRKYSQKKLKQKAVESYEVKKRNIQFESFEAVKFNRSSLLDWVLVKPFRFMNSLLRANQLIRKYQPDVFVSFGGYLAVPLALMAKIRGTKVLTHEGTRVFGLANRLIAVVADRIAVAAEQTRNQISCGDKTVVTGNPLRTEILNQDPVRPSWIRDQIDKPVLLVMGGNQGSLVINQIIKSCLGELLNDWTLIHQCGRPNQIANYQQELQVRAKSLSSVQQARYYVLPWIDGTDLAWIYQQAFGAISRAGANSVLELAVNRVPTIFVPLAQAHLDEQQKNAQYLTKRDAALLLSEEELSTQNLFKQLKQLRQHHDQLKTNLAKLDLKTEAAANLYQVLSKLVHE